MGRFDAIRQRIELGVRRHPWYSALGGALLGRDLHNIESILLEKQMARLAQKEPLVARTLDRLAYLGNTGLGTAYMGYIYGGKRFNKSRIRGLKSLLGRVRTTVAAHPYRIGGAALGTAAGLGGLGAYAYYRSHKKRKRR